MMEWDWSDLITQVRRRLNDSKGHWGDVAYKLSRAEGIDQSQTYRWLREFSDAKNEKIDGGKLQRLAHALDMTIIFMTPLEHTNGGRKKSIKRNG